MKKPKRKEAVEEPPKRDQMSKLMTEVEASNPSFVSWLRKKSGRKEKS